MSRQMLICVRERGYAKRLAEYIAVRREYPFSVHYCTDIEKSRQLAEHLRPDYLVMDDRLTSEERDSLTGMRRFVLSESADALLGDGEISVFKYASAHKILERVTSSSLDDRGMTRPAVGEEHVKIIGFYSPVKRVGQTTLALAIGSRLAGGDGTLYLNLCAYADGHFDGEEVAGLDRYLYYLEQEAPNSGLRLKSMAGQRGELDYLLPVPLRDDLEAVGESTWMQLIRTLKQEAPYGYVLLDLSEEVRGLREIMKQCAIVYMPVTDDEYASAKVMSFSNELKTVGDAELIHKIRKVRMNREIPVIADNCVRAIQAEGDRRGPSRRDQRESPALH